VDQIPGTWKQIRERDVDLGQSQYIPKAELPKLYKQMDAYAELLHQGLGKFTGFHAQWYRSSGGELFKGGPASYQLNVPMFRYGCVKGVAERNSEYGDEVSIEVNGIWHMSGSGNQPLIEGKKYQLFGSPVGEIRGFPVFEPFWHNGPGGVSVRWVMIVHKPGRLPFHYATRKEVLDSLKAINEDKRAEALAKWDRYDRIRPQAEQEKDRAKELALFLKGAKDEQQKQKWTERFDHDYRTDEQKHAAQRQKYNAIHDKIREHFDKLLASQAPEQLQQMALADGYSPDERFEFKPPKSEVCPTTECSEHLGKPLAIPVRSYFDETLPQSSPQFFAVTFELSARVVRRDGKYNVEEPRLEKMRDEFFARFDFDKLVSMIGK